MEVVYLVAVSLVALVASIVGLRRSRDRWGVERAAVEAGAGAYRAGSVTHEVARRAPRSVWLAAPLAQVWGAITLFVLVPAGAFLALVLLFSSGNQTAGGPLVAIGVGSGVVLAVRLLRAGSALARRAPDAPLVAREAAMYSARHHALLWLVFPAAVLGLRGLGDYALGLLVLAPPCCIGLLVALALRLAGRRVAALDAEERRVAALDAEDRAEDQARISTSSPTAISIDA